MIVKRHKFKDSGLKKSFVLNLKDSDWLIRVFGANAELHKTPNPEITFIKPDCSTALVVQGASDWLVSAPGRYNDSRNINLEAFWTD